jgi:hypothetical protein
MLVRFRFVISMGKPRSDRAQIHSRNGEYSSAAVFETYRPKEQCDHLDAGTKAYPGTQGPIVFKVPKNTMVKGAVSLCVSCYISKAAKAAHTVLGDPATAPTISVQVGVGGKPARRSLVYYDKQPTFEFVKDGCFSLAPPLLPTEQDVYIHIDCSDIAADLRGDWSRNVSGDVFFFLTA